MGANAFYVSTVVGRVFIFATFCAMVATGRFLEPALLVGHGFTHHRGD